MTRGGVVTAPDLATGGDITGPMAGAGIAAVTAFGQVGVNVTAATNFGNVWALGNIADDLIAGVSGIYASSWRTSSGNVTPQDVSAWAS